MTAFVNWSHLSDELTPLAFKREERNPECSNYSCPIYSFYLSHITAGTVDNHQPYVGI